MYLQQFLVCTPCDVELLTLGNVTFGKTYSAYSQCQILSQTWRRLKWFAITNFENVQEMECIRMFGLH